MHRLALVMIAACAQPARPGAVAAAKPGVERMWTTPGDEPNAIVLEIRSTTERGVIWIDGTLVGAITGGTARLTRISEGRHQLRLGADDHHAITTTVTLRRGQVLHLEVRLAEGDVLPTAAR